MSIACAANTYTIGGSITGLTATGLVLQNNTADDLTVAANATTFSFATKVTGTYAVTVKTQPTGLTCTVSNDKGKATADITNVSVSCRCSIYGTSCTALNSTAVVTTLASISLPNRITTDGTNLYVAVAGASQRIDKVVISTGVITTIAGSGTAADTDGTGTAASFSVPYGITTDGTNLYVTTAGNKIRKVVIATGVVTTIAGSGTAAEADGTGADAKTIIL